MFLIILFHYVYNGGFNLDESIFTLNKAILRILGFGGKFMIIGAICAFSLFRRLKIKPSKIINRIAAGTFGVYLLHEHELIRNLLWIRCLKTYTFYDSAWYVLVLHMLLSCVGVFVIGVIVDLIYQNIISKWLMAFYDKASDRVKMYLVKSNHGYSGKKYH